MMNIESKEITCTCNVCGALYTDKQTIINNVPTIKFNMCPKCVEEHRLENIVEDVKKKYIK